MTIKNSVMLEDFQLRWEKQLAVELLRFGTLLPYYMHQDNRLGHVKLKLLLHCSKLHFAYD